MGEFGGRCVIPEGTVAVPDNADSWPANSAGDQTMTGREAEVAELVSQGLANRAVAKQLGIGPGTVKVHLHNIYQKLHLSNRIGLISGHRT